MSDWVVKSKFQECLNTQARIGISFPSLDTAPLKAYLHDIHFGHGTPKFWLAGNMGHGPLDFCRVKANFSAHVPKNLSGSRPPQEAVSARLIKGPRAETGGIYRSQESLLP